MEKIKKLLKAFPFKTEIVNLMLGIALVVALFLIFLKPDNKAALLTACIAGGFINILNGLRIVKEPKKSTMGMTYIMMGILLIFLGFLLYQLNRH